MKRKNVFANLFLIIMLINVGIGVIKFNDYKEYWAKDSEERVKECLKYDNVYPSEGTKFLCDYLFDEDTSYSSFSETVDGINGYMPLSINNFITIFLVVFCSCYHMCKYLKSNMISNNITRESYFKIIKGLFLNAWKSVLVLPLTIFILLAVSYLYCGNFDMIDTLSLWDIEAYASIPLFIITLFSIPVLACLIYSNVSLIVSRKQHNWILATVISYIIVIGIDLFLEIIVKELVDKLIIYGFGYIFNIIAFFPFLGAYGVWPPLLLYLTLAIVTTVILVLVYKDKEKLLIDCEADR